MMHQRVTHPIPNCGITEQTEYETTHPRASRRVSSSERMKYNWKDWRRVTPMIVLASSLFVIPLTHAFSSSSRTFSRVHSFQQHQQHRSSSTSPTNLIGRTLKHRHRAVLSSHSSDDAVSVSTTTTTDETTTDELVYQTAIRNTLAWVAAAVLFGGALGFLDGPTTASEFFAGYLVEQSLSVDNLFVFLLLFEYFGVPLAYQNRVLNWGIAGAVLMRAIMIGLGAAALSQYRAILLVFAGILVYSSASFFLGNDDDDNAEDPSENSIVQFSKSLLPSTDEFDGDRFFTISEGVRKATPLFICMVAVEISDIVFAVDSIPAVFGVTENPLVVFSSNMFAILGLRSLFTILSKAAADLAYLEPAVALVLGFIGSKMIAEYFHILIPTNIALAVVATLLSGGVGLSLLEKEKLAELDDDKSV